MLIVQTLGEHERLPLDCCHCFDSNRIISFGNTAALLQLISKWLSWIVQLCKRMWSFYKSYLNLAEILRADDWALVGNFLYSSAEHFIKDIVFCHTFPWFWILVLTLIKRSKGLWMFRVKSLDVDINIVRNGNKWHT